MATVDAGVRVTCPGCGETVLQKAMIPMVGDGGQGVRYMCNDCARKDVVTGTASGAASGTESAEPTQAGAPAAG